MRIARDLQKYLQSICPYDTGNMKANIKCERVSRDEYRVIVGGTPAPYAVYTNERWIDKRWKGKQNPNEKWIDMGVDHFAALLAQKLKGDLSESGYEDRWDNKRYHDNLERAGR